MNEIAMREQNALIFPEATKELIRAGVSENTLRAYRRALLELDRWISDAVKILIGK